MKKNKLKSSPKKNSKLKIMTQNLKKIKLTKNQTKRKIKKILKNFQKMKKNFQKMKREKKFLSLPPDSSWQDRHLWPVYSYWSPSESKSHY